MGFSTYLTDSISDAQKVKLTLWLQPGNSNVFALVATTITAEIQKIGMSIGTRPILRESSAHYMLVGDRVRYSIQIGSYTLLVHPWKVEADPDSKSGGAHRVGGSLSVNTRLLHASHI
jgi:hypothetical protein